MTKRIWCVKILKNERGEEVFSRVYVEITNICNKNCSFCPKTKRAPKLLSKEEFDEILTKIKPVTDYLYYHVMGEPLTHPKLPTFIEDADRMGFKSAITTNGTFLAKRGEELINSGVYKVNISLHSFEGGDDAEHQKYVSECLDFADKASKNGILVVLRLWNGGVSDTKNAQTERMISEKFGSPEQISSRGARLRNKLHLEYADRFVWPDMGAIDEGDNVFCQGLNDHFGILSDGTVVPCCLDHEGDISLGNVFEQDIKEILSGEKACTIKNGFHCKKAVEELCRKCSYARRFKV